jgi:deoxyadenosine/deoxycytidine kinase
MAGIVFTLDGSIGAGKSTILGYLNDKYRISVEVEPINKWQPFLNELYGNKESSAFNLQIRVWLDRCWINDTMSFPMIMERSPLFQEKVFVKVNTEIKRISDVQVDLITEMYNLSGKMWQPHGYVYLRSDPTKCIQRIAKRARNSEDAIPVDYMIRLHELHEEAYIAAVAEGKPIVCVDVEGKTVKEIGEEVWVALQSLSVK